MVGSSCQGRELPNDLNVSVAMCTYNGARFLNDQLESIASQSRLPDELILCDDCSSDDTVAIARAFAIRAPFPVRVFVNAENLGSTVNFGQAIAHCTGEILFLSDQDDHWKPEKIARILQEFEAHPAAGMVFSDAQVVDEALHPISDRLWDCTQFFEDKQDAFRRGNALRLQLRQNFVTGATMAFRANLRPLILPIPTDVVVIHDGWIATLISAVAGVVIVREPLILYRQHSAQQLGVTREVPQTLMERVRPKEHYLKHLQQVELLRGRLQAYQSAKPDVDLAAALSQVDSLIRHLKTRARLSRNLLFRLPLIVREVVALRYHRHSNGWLSALRDLY